MRIGIMLLLLVLGTGPAVAQEPRPTAPASPPVPLTQEQRLQLAAFEAQYRAAIAEAENAQLRRLLYLTQIKEKVGPGYEFDNSAQAFVKRPEPPKSSEAPGAKLAGVITEPVTIPAEKKKKP